MKKTIIISTIFFLSIFIQGCYTQLAMFYPDPEIESSEEDQFYDTYNRAIPSLKAESYAQSGRATMPLSYSAMQRRFYSPYSSYSGFSDYYDPFYTGLNGYRYGYGYNGYNSYGYAPYLYTNDNAGYGSLIPTGNRVKRSFARDRSQGTTTMLQTTRSTQSSNNNTNSTYTNSGSISSSRSSSSYSSSNSSKSSSSSKSSGGRRATKRR